MAVSGKMLKDACFIETSVSGVVCKLIGNLLLMPRFPVCINIVEHIGNLLHTAGATHYATLAIDPFSFEDI
jgi:hypothetical protein